MKILFCSSEIAPFAKTGGLADVSSALPQALERLGCRVHVALPKYRCVRQKAQDARMGKDIDVHLIENDRYFNREGLYGEIQGDYPDNLERFAFFCRQILEFIKKIDFKPDIIHCNDWQTALIPVYLKTKFSDDPFFARTEAVITIHNLAYQGIFDKSKFPQTGLDWRFFNAGGLKFHGKVNLLKGGLLFSRFITTVSQTYAREIQTPRFGCGLDGVLRKRKKDLLGIINGLDYEVWNPTRDNEIFQRYSKENLDNKYVNKERLQQQLSLPCGRDIPLLGIVTRLAEQKGIELIISALDKIARLDLQFILLGTGNIKYLKLLEKINQKGYKNISINLRFDPILAHRIYAACDMFLMPSNFEPCGLGQLISLKYGTIPIVRKTGGLADTITDYNPEDETGNGFVFKKYKSEHMLQAIMRAVALHRDRERWQKLMRRAMDYDFSWENSAKKYIGLYNRALNEK